MKFISKLLKNTIILKLFNCIKYTYTYIKDKHYISDTLYSKQFKFVLDQYLHTDIKTDWLGRLYCIINPAIDNNGDFNISNMIIELDGDNTNNNEHIKQWTYKQMKLIAHLFKIEKLYDYINIEFTHVGPENMDNYLLVFDIVSRKQMSNSYKKFIKHLFVYIILFFIVVLICFNIF
jgi:hypothetical protein